MWIDNLVCIIFKCFYFRGWEERKYSEIFPVKPLSDETVLYNRTIYGSNEIYLKLTPILVTLLSEVSLSESHLL